MSEARDGPREYGAALHVGQFVRWRLWLIVVPAMIVFAIALRDAVAWVDRPFAGMLFLDNRIVASIGRTTWRSPMLRAVEWARIVAVESDPVASASEVHEAIAGADGRGTLVVSFRQGAEMFRVDVPILRFHWRDFVAVFAPMLGVGAWLIVGAALPMILRPASAAAWAAFLVCATIGVVLMTGPDQYGPYRFTPLHYAALAVSPASIVHLATAFPRPRPERWVRHLVRGLYVAGGAAGAALFAWRFDPLVFLPLLYLVYVGLANALLLYVGVLVSALAGGAQPRRPVLLALVGVVAASSVGIIVVIGYPLFAEPVTASSLILPMAWMPVFTGCAVLDRTTA